MINFKMTIDNVVVDNQYILDSIEFTTESGQQDYTVGSLFIPAVKTKLHNDVEIAYDSTVKIHLIGEDNSEIPYGIFEPYEIKQSNLYRELTLYPSLYFTLNETYNPQDSQTTRQLVQNMQLELGFLVENINDISIVDMHGLKADSAINLLKDIALVSATNIIINRSGKIEFKRITSNSTVYTIDGAYITEITKSDTVPYQITQVVGKVDDNSETEEIVAGTSTNKWNTMTITNAHITQSIVNNIYNSLSTVTYSGFELKIFNAPINLEVLDKIKFTYKGTNYTIPVMDLSIIYSRGGLVAKIKANVSTALDKTTSHKGSVTSKLEVIRNITQELNTKLDIQDGQIQSLISQTTIVEGDKEVSIKDKYSEITQDISGIKIQVGSTETKLDKLEQEVKNNLSSYSILLSNENHVFPTDSSGKITEEITVTTDVTVHKGMNEVAFTIGNLPTVNGFTLSKTDKTITITANVGTSMAESGTIEIPITVDGIDFTKTFSYAKAKAGADNQNISVIGEQVFKYSNNFTGTPTPEMITLSVIRNNINTQGKWQYLDENDIWMDYYQNNVLQTGDTINISYNSKIFGTTDAKTMRVRYYISDDMKDEMTLVKISDGKNGIDGTTIVNIKEQYYLSTSQQTLINGSWQDSAPTWETGKYIWTRTVFTYNNNTTSTTEPICVTGKDGADGLNGGVSVSNVDVFYYQSTSATQLTGGEWSTNAPTWVNGKYVWTKTITYLDNGSQMESQAVCISGEKGQDGIKGHDSYFYVRYSANANGNPMTVSPNADSKYMGVATTTSSTAPTSYANYTWTLIKGDKGEQGIQGNKGADGKTTYLHIKYSNDGKTFTNNNGEELGKWIGTYVDFTEADSTNFNNYTWKKYVGDNGADAMAVSVTGEQVFKYANNFAGTPTPETIPLTVTRINTTASGKWQYMDENSAWQDFTQNGTLQTGNTLNVSYNSKIFGTSDAKSMRLRYYISDSLYDEITLVKISDGAKGTDGKNGIDGINGKDGVSTYFYVRYSANANGSSMTSTPTSSSLYMGVCSTTSATAPTNASSYQWTLIKGSDGKDGIPGTNGTNGQTSYLHIKYSNDGKTFTSNNGEDLGKWIGTYVDFNQADSTSFGSYTWSKYVGEDGQDGTDGTDAYTIILTNEAQPIPTTNSRVPMSASTYSTDIIVYQGTIKRTDFTLGTINSANGITVAKPSNSKVNFTVSTGTALGADNGTFTIPITIDSKTFNKVFSWSCSKQGNKGDKGDAGNDAYTVILTNENHTFNAEQNGNIPTAITTTTKVIAYKGATSVTPTIGTLPSVGGLTITKASDGVTINIQANTGTSLATNGKFDIPITVDGKSFTKSFSWSKVNKGTNAYSASIGASSQVFKSMDGGQTYTPNTITLTPILQNLSFSKWQYSTNGGSSFTDVASGSNGLTVSSNKLTISKDSSLFTTSISSITFKLVTNNSSYYDTMTIVKLNDIGELEVGSRNYLLATSGTVTINGTNTTDQSTQIYNIVGGTNHTLAGKQVTMSFEFSVSSGSTGTFKIQTNGTYASPATSGSWISLSDSINVANNGGKITKTVTIPEDSAKRFSGIQVRMDSFSGSLTISKAKLEIGNIPTDWSPAPEDGINYTDELVNDLREIDLQDLINLNNQAVSKIDSIIQDGQITPNEKVDLQAEFARIALLRGSTKDFYDTVNDTALSTLLNDMETTYQNVKTLINPVISDMTTTSNASASEIRRAFIAFYEINQSLLTALQQSVAIISINNSTSIEALEEKVSITASKQTEYATKIDEISSHLDFTQEGFVQIYATTNGVKGRFETQITDQKLAFKDNGEEVAYISNQEMYITKATITDQMQIGNFIIKPSGTANGGIMFIHIDNA